MYILPKKAKDAGFNDAWIGVEALSDADLKEMNKEMTMNQIFLLYPTSLKRE